MSVQLDVMPAKSQNVRGHNRYGSACGTPGIDGDVQKMIWDYPLDRYRGKATRLCENHFFTDEELIYKLYEGKQ